jgi:hypothetical protein
MKKIKKFLVTAAIIFSGMAFSSLWITNSDSWKIYFPIVLTCISFKISLDQ